MRKATPRPWVVQRIDPKDKEWVASEIWADDICVASHVNREVDALHVVKCVNLHDELVEFVKRTAKSEEVSEARRQSALRLLKKVGK